MAIITLIKGGRICCDPPSRHIERGEARDLTEYRPGLVIRLGFGWKTDAALNFDILAFEIDQTLKIISDGHFVCAGLTISADRALLLEFDDRERRDDRDDRDAMLIYLNRVDPKVDQIIICLCLVKFPNDPKGDRCTLLHHLGMAGGYYLRLVDEASGKELVRYDVREQFDGKDALEFGRLYRTATSWGFEAMGRAREGGLLTLIDSYVEGWSTRERGA